MKRKLKIFCVIITLLGMAGAVLFFPVKINSEYTCLYHRMFNESSGAANSGGVNTAGRMVNGGAGKTASVPSQMESSTLVEQYIHNYAFFWWGSLLLIVLAYYLVKYRKQQKTTILHN